MLVVVADTGPVHYLVLIGEARLLPQLFGKILIPDAVRDELLHPEAPAAVRDWTVHPPDWLEVHAASSVDNTGPELTRLDRGEQAALALAEMVRADLLLIDDREGVSAARSKGFAVTGTLGVLDLAARRGLLDLATAVTRLKATNFRYRRKFSTPCLRHTRQRKRIPDNRPGRPARSRRHRRQPDFVFEGGPPPPGGIGVNFRRESVKLCRRTLRKHNPISMRLLRAFSHHRM